MKRFKILALTGVLAFSLLGTGYAYWTDQMTIEGTVATGELQVRFIDVSSQDIAFTYAPVANRFDTLTMSIGGVEGLAVDKWVAAKVVYKNCGTIPSTPGTIMVDNVKFDNKVDTTNTVSKHLEFYVGDAGEYTPETGSIINFSELGEVLRTKLAEYLYPEEEAIFYIGMRLKENNDTIAEKTMGFDITIPWVQWNDLDGVTK